MHLIEKFIDIERRRRTAPFTFDERGTQRLKLGFMFLKQAQARSNDLLRRIVTALSNLPFNELGEVVADNQIHRLRHGSLQGNDIVTDFNHLKQRLA